ncbi:MAG TPA: hypothetical protein ENK80_05125 [Rhodobacterales bacterium]|nr:hypothetical protein [Rhodobacterales bacterium]
MAEQSADQDAETGSDGDTLTDEVRALRAEVMKLNQQRYFQIESSLWQVAFWNLVRGLAWGLGSVLGATILLSLLVRVLGSMDFIPVLGEWGQRLIEEIQQGNLAK